MRRIVLTGLFFLLLSIGAFPQKVQIFDSKSKMPVTGAVIYNERDSRFVESNELGEADLSVFQRVDTLVIQHPGYKLYALPMAKLGAAPSPIYLQEKVIRIDEVVISANKWEQKKSEIPFEIMSLGLDEIAKTNPQTAADLLEATGQVFVQKSQLGGGSPMIRGFGANSVLIVVDGVRMNNAIFRGGNLQNVINIDPNALESSEVIFGPGAVIYGSDALGGVMDFHTIEPVYGTREKMALHGNGMIRYNTANRERTGSLQVGLGRKNWAYTGTFTYSDFDDLLTGSVRPEAHPDFGKRPEYVSRINGRDSVISNDNVNLQRFSGYSQINTLQKISFRLSGRSELTYTLNYSTTSNIPRYDRLTLYDDDQLTYAEWYYGPQKWMMNSLNFSDYKANKLYDAMKLTGAYQIFEESRHDRRLQNVIRRNRTEEVGVISLNADFEKDLDTRNHFFYGFEYLYNRVSSSAFSEGIGTGEISDLSTRYPDGGSEVHGLAAYLSYKRDIRERFFFSTGLRYTYQHLYSSFVDAPFDYGFIKNVSDAVNGNAGLVYRPGEDFVLSGMISSGFRAPNVDDISRVFDSEPGNVLVPNPDLSPEYSCNAELSATRIVNEKIELSGTVFYSLLRNAMVRDDFAVNGRDSILYDGVMSRVRALVNSGRANIYGFNLGIRADLANAWSASASFNITEGRDLENDEPLRHTTPPFGLVSINYAQSRISAEFYVRFNGARKLENMPESERLKTHIYSSEGSLAWYTLNLRVHFKATDWLGMDAAFENILNHHYRTYSSGISAPGRNLSVSFRGYF